MRLLALTESLSTSLHWLRVHLRSDCISGEGDRFIGGFLLGELLSSVLIVVFVADRFEQFHFALGTALLSRCCSGMRLLGTDVDAI